MDPITTPMSIIDQLSGLVGARPRAVSEDSYIVTIEDRKAWRASLEQLIPLFGELVFREYGIGTYELDSPLMRLEIIRQLELSFRRTKRMYLITLQQEIVGLCTLEEHDLDHEVGILGDIIVREGYRGKGYGERLYTLLFSNNSLRALVGVKTSPTAVVIRGNIASRYGYQSYFADMPGGDVTTQRLRKLTMHYLEQEGMLLDSSLLPEGFVLLNSRVLPPLQEDDIFMSPENPLFDIFYKILELQKNYQEGTVAGILVTFKTPSES